MGNPFRLTSFMDVAKKSGTLMSIRTSCMPSLYFNIVLDLTHEGHFSLTCSAHVSYAYI